MIKLIITHPGSAHKDDFLACCVLIAESPVSIHRKDPDCEDLDDSSVAVIDVGDRHEPNKKNFDHHQFPRDRVPTCSLSLVLQDLGLYDDARSFCDWLETAEWFDCRGANATANWLGAKREIIGRMSSPIELSLLRRFASQNEHLPGEPLWEIMKMIGKDLVDYLRGLRRRLQYISEHSEVWNIKREPHSLLAIYLPRTHPLPDDPSMGLPRFIEENGLAAKAHAMIYPDRRGEGYGLCRYNDHPSMDFNRISSEPDVHFVHAAGFIAKTSATDSERLQDLLFKSHSGCS